MMIEVFQVREVTGSGFVTPNAELDGKPWFAPLYPTYESAKADIEGLLKLASGDNAAQTIHPEWTVIQLFGWGEDVDKFKV
ncbi:hypothetical protein N8072_01640 [bacterium]|nr:hypothetical protein [bacterium]MDB4128547.1 hypothetical protein [bacterium]MDC1257357.1 hypothetical protein [bacterium]